MPDPLAGYTPNWRKRSNDDDPLAGYSSSWREEKPKVGALGTAKDVGEQVAAATADFSLRNLRGISNLIGGAAKASQLLNPTAGGSGAAIADLSERASNRLQKQREEVARYAPADTRAGVAANLLTNFAEEGLSYIAGGGALRKGTRLLAPTAEVAQGASRLTRAGRALKEVVKDAAAVAPIDINSAAVGPENSIAGVASELTKEKFPRFSKVAGEVAENPLTRGVVEVGTGGLLDAGLRLAAAGARGTWGAGKKAYQAGRDAVEKARTSRLPPPEPEVPRVTPEVRPEPVQSTQVDRLPTPEPPRTVKPKPKPERRGEARPLVAQMHDLEKALPTAEADPNTRVIAISGSADVDTEMQRLGSLAQGAGAPPRVFTIGGEDYVILAPAKQADAVVESVRSAGYKASSGNTLREADESLRAGNLEEVRARVNGNGKPKVEPIAEAPETPTPRTEATPAVADAGAPAPKGRTAVDRLNDGLPDDLFQLRTKYVTTGDQGAAEAAREAVASNPATREALTRNLREALGDEITVYRGGERNDDLLQSWTTDKATAEYFAQLNDGTVHSGVVRATDVAFPGGGVDNELVVRSRDVRHVGGGTTGGTKPPTAKELTSRGAEVFRSLEVGTRVTDPSGRTWTVASRASDPGVSPGGPGSFGSSIKPPSTKVVLKDGTDEVAIESGMAGWRKLGEWRIDDAAATPAVETPRPTPETSGVAPREAPGATSRVSEMSVDDIDVEPERFQFKIDTNSKGVGRELEGVEQYDPELAGVIQVWRDPADGRFKVVNGHHRLDLAKRLGVKQVGTLTINAPDAATARTVGAMTNIAEGRGTPVDAAKLFREQGVTPEALKARNVPLRGAIARDGLALANLPDALFRQVVTGELPLQRAVTMGSSGLDEAQQLALHKILREREAKGKTLKNDEVAELVRFVKGAGEQTAVQETLFGAESFAKSLAPEKAVLSANVRERLSRDKRLFAFLGKDKRAARVGEEGVGSVDAGKARAIADAAAGAEEVYIRLSGMRGPVADALNEAASKLAKGGDRHAIQQELYERVRSAVETELASLRRTPSGDAGLTPRGAGERAGAAADRPDADPAQEGLGLFANQPGGASPEVVGAIARAGLYAAGGGVAGAALAPEGHGKTGAVVGAALASGMSLNATRAALKRAGMKAADAKYLTDPDVAKVAASVGTTPPAVRSFEELKKVLGGVAGDVRHKASRDILPVEEFGKVVEGTDRLKEVSAKVRGSGAAAFQYMDDFLALVFKSADEVPLASRALARAERGLELVKYHEKGATPEQIKEWEKTVAELGDKPEVREAVDKLKRYFRSLLEMKRDAGVITQERFDKIIKDGDAYIPTIPEDALKGIKTGSGGGRYTPNKFARVRRMGKDINEENIVDPFDQAIYDTQETFQTVGKQHLANAIAEVTEKNPAKALPFLREVTPERGPGGVLLTPKSEDGGKMVQAIVNGKTKFYEITHQPLADAWATFSPPSTHLAMKGMRGIKAVMQGGVTSNPVFALANGIRDFFMSGVQYPLFEGSGKAQLAKAGLTLGGGAAAGALANPDDRLVGAAAGAGLAGTVVGLKHTGKHIARSLSAMNDILGPQAMGAVIGGTAGAFTGHEQDVPGGTFLGFLAGMGVGAGVGHGVRNIAKGNREVYKEFLREGGGGFGFYARNTKEAKRIHAQLVKEGVSASDFAYPKTWWDAVQTVSRAVETAPRLALYKEMRAAGKEVGESIFAARDLSLDFSVRPGSRGLRAYAETVAFLNPAIQGTDKLLRLLTDPKTTATAAATIVAPTVGLWALNHLTPEMGEAYDNRPQYEKNTHWLVPKMGLDGVKVGEWWRIPKPFEVGFIYASIPERVLDFVNRRDPEAVTFALRDMWGQYADSFIGLPTIIAPQVEIRSGEHGYDPFRRREIDPMPYKNLPAEFQSDDRTSTLAIGLANAIPGEQSPAKIDYAIRGYTGTLGGEALNLTSKAARNLGWDDRPEPSTRSTVLLSRFETKPENATETELSLRRRFKKAEKKYNALQQLLDEGQLDKARKYRDRHISELRQYGVLEAQMAQLAEVTKARRHWMAADIPAEEKRAKLAELSARVPELLKRLENQEQE